LPDLYLSSNLVRTMCLAFFFFMGSFISSLLMLDPMKKKRRKVAGEGGDAAANISNESIEAESDKTEAREAARPVTLVSCGVADCEKKFSSESALRYHVTFAHERIKRVDPAPAPAPAPLATPAPAGEEPLVSNGGGVKQEKEKVRGRAGSSGAATTGNTTNTGNSGNTGNTGNSFPSTQNIRPILPAQPSPHLPGPPLKPIQPPPALLPPPARNLNLDTLKKPLVNKSSSSVSVKPESGVGDRQDPAATAMDLSTGPVTNGGPHPGDLGSKVMLPASIPSSLASPSLASPALASMTSPPKARTPMISIKSEFNTGNKQSLSDIDKDELQVLQHFSKAPPGPAPFPPEYLSSALLGGVPGAGLGVPPHLLPGLMGHLPPGLPPPPASANLSPFGASLESLARAAEERARSFGGGFSPAQLPASAAPGGLFSPAAAGFSPAGSAGSVAASPAPPGAPPPRGGVSRAATPSSSSEAGGEAPLLRHEHMHTHLHYITSPTHASQ